MLQLPIVLTTMHAFCCSKEVRPLSLTLIVSVLLRRREVLQVLRLANAWHCATSEVRRITGTIPLVSCVHATDRSEYLHIRQRALGFAPLCTKLGDPEACSLNGILVVIDGVLKMTLNTSQTRTAQISAVAVGWSVEVDLADATVVAIRVWGWVQWSPTGRLDTSILSVLNS